MGHLFIPKAAIPQLTGSSIIQISAENTIPKELYTSLEEIGKQSKDTQVSSAAWKLIIPTSYSSISYYQKL